MSWLTHSTALVTQLLDCWVRPGADLSGTVYQLFTLPPETSRVSDADAKASMSDLAHGLAPKMKPISGKRSAIVCALDIGTSKIVCAIARLKPRPPQDVLPRRTHSVDVLGIGHAQAQGMKAGNVVDIAAAEEMLRHAVDQAERAAGVHVDASCSRSPRAAPPANCSPPPCS